MKGDKEVGRASLISVFAALVLAAGPAAYASQSDQLRFDITETGHMVVDIEVNGDNDALAIIDTAATFPIIDRATADLASIELPVSPVMIDIVGLGEVRTFPVVNVGQLTLGALEMQNVPAAYNAKIRFPSTGNVIPASSLPYRTLDFDFRNTRLRLYDAPPRTVRGAHTGRLKIIRHGGLPFIEVSVNGLEGLALIDTGASITFVNSAFAQGAASSARAVRTIELVGATGNVTPVKILYSRRFQLSDFTVNRFNVVVSDPEFLQMLGLGETPVMVLGLDVLKSFRVQIDRQSEELRLSIPGNSLGRGAGMSIRTR